MFKPAETKTFQVDIYHTINVEHTKISKKICYKTSENAQKVLHEVRVIFFFEITLIFLENLAEAIGLIQTDSESKRILYICCYLKSVNLLCAL